MFAGQITQGSQEMIQDISYCGELGDASANMTGNPNGKVCMAMAYDATDIYTITHRQCKMNRPILVTSSTGHYHNVR